MKHRYFLPLALLSVILLTQLPAFAQQKKPATKKKTTATKSKKINSHKTGTSTTVKQNPPSPPKYNVPEPPRTPDETNITPSRQHSETSPLKKAFNDPFRKGTFSFINRANASYQHYKSTPGERDKHANFQAAADLNYFFLNHFAIGLDARYSSTNHTDGYSDIFHSWQAYLNLTYGRAIIPWVGIYARVGGGIGHSKSEQNIASGGIAELTVLNADYNEFHGSLGFPIAAEAGSPLFVTPYFNYSVQKTTTDNNHSITDNGFTFGIRLESYLNAVTTKLTDRPADRAYTQQGKSFLEFNTGAGLSSSTRKESQGSIAFAPVKRKSNSITLGYNVFVLDNLAVGLTLGWASSNVENPGSAPAKISSFLFQPMITGHVPVNGPLHNLFAQIGYGWESAKVFGNKEKRTYFPLRIGYNFFLGKNISLTPKFGYERDKSDHTTAGGVYTNSGIVGEIGVRGYIGRKLF